MLIFFDFYSIADQPWLERNERQRMFAHLSLDVFEKHTNIRDLIGDEYTAKNEKIPSLLHLNLKAKDYFEQVKSPEGWSAAIFDNLDFVIPEDQQNEYVFKFYVKPFFFIKTVIFYTVFQQFGDILKKPETRYMHMQAKVKKE